MTKIEKFTTNLSSSNPALAKQTEWVGNENKSRDTDSWRSWSMLFLLIPPWHPRSVHLGYFFFHNTLTQPHLSCGYPFVFHLVLDPEGKNPALPCDAGPHLAVPRTRQATTWAQVWGQTRSALDLNARFHWAPSRVRT